MVLLWAGQVHRSVELYRKVFGEFVQAGGMFNEPEALAWYSAAAFLEGDLALANDVAERFTADVAKGRSAHTQSHLHAVRSVVRFGRGDWDGVADEWHALDELVERSPEVSFCLLGAAAIGYGAVAQQERGVPLTIDLRAAMERTTEDSELIRAASIMLSEAMRGDVQGYERGLSAYAEGLRLYDRAALWDLCWLGPTIGAVTLSRWDELDTALRHLDDCAAGGSRLAGAFAAAVREERAAATNGGPAPAHADLLALGYGGLSELLSFRTDNNGTG